MFEQNLPFIHKIEAAPFPIIAAVQGLIAISDDRFYLKLGYHSSFAVTACFSAFIIKNKPGNVEIIKIRGSATM